MPVVITIICLLAVCCLIFFYLIAPAKYTSDQAAPFYGQYIAHRGLHSGDGKVPENSMPAFRAAAESGYGMEFDLHITKDGHVVVFHDDDLTRVCGVTGRLEDMTLAEVRELRLLGSEETVPLFSELLEMVAGRYPLIVEFKTSERNEALCETALKMLREYRGPYCVESFDPRIVAWFRKNAPEIMRGQLASPPAILSRKMTKGRAFCLGNLLTNFSARPQFIAYRLGELPFPVRLCQKMGALRVCWTSVEKSAETERDNDVIIFQFYKPAPKYK